MLTLKKGLISFVKKYVFDYWGADLALDKYKDPGGYELVKTKYIDLDAPPGG